MVLLALVEVLVLSARFDSGVLHETRGLLSFFADHLPLVPQLFAVAAAGTLVFGGKDLVESLGRASRQSTFLAAPLFLALHLVMFAVFWAISAYYFEVNRGANASALAVWVFCGLATAATWLAVLVDPFVWAAVVRDLSWPMLIGLCVGVLAWFAGQWAISGWGPLGFVTFQLVWLILTVFGVAVTQDTSQLTIGTSEFAVRIAPECSGYEGMGLAAVFITTYLWWKRAEHLFPRSLLLVPIAIGLMFVVNAIRIAVLILIGHFGSPEIALGGFHSQAGWIGFNLVSLGIIAFARACPWFRSSVVHKGSASEVEVAYTSVPLLAPFVALTLSIVLLGIVRTGFDWLYPVRVIVVVALIGICIRRYPKNFWQLGLHWSTFAIGIAVYVIWSLLETNDGGIANSLYESAQSVSPKMFACWLAFRVFGSVVTVPLAEEFAFRGYLIPWLSGEHDSRKWSVVAVVVSSIAFGMMHPGHWIAGTFAGVAYAMAYCRRGSVMDAVIAHATTNGLIALEAVCLSRWYLWG